MSDEARRVVFDCNVFAQAVISPTGPAAGCIERVLDGTIQLFWSNYILSEIRRIPEKPTPIRLGVTIEMIESFVSRLLPIAHHVSEAPQAFEHPIDPKDSHYINLALVSNASLIVSRDKHLLNLTDPSKTGSAEFVARFPGLTILQPHELLELLRRN